MSILTLDNVSLTYNNDDRPAITDISFEIEEGEFMAVVGPSGCGKSSTVSLLSGLTLPSTGTITLNGSVIQGPGIDRAVVFQDYSLFPWMTAFENIQFALNQLKRSSSAKDTKKEALNYLELVGLSEAKNKYPGELSGGMRQRVAIARAFALNAPVYLMDEPFGAVDAKSRVALQDLLLRLWVGTGRKKTVFLVTHDIDEALYLADRIVVFTPGPGRIRRIVPVPFARPRQRYFLIQEPAYIALRNELLSLLQHDLLDEIQQVEEGSGI